jgi:predicted RNA-binding Zn-ribbon protein involved in translation (DUF1610 family)
MKRFYEFIWVSGLLFLLMGCGGGVSESNTATVIFKNVAKDMSVIANWNNQKIGPINPNGSSSVTADTGDNTMQWQDKDGNDLDEPKKVCKYCESDIALTEFGVQKKKESDERTARWLKEAAEDEEAVPCFSCGMMHKESELPEVKETGYYCPDCNEDWVMMDSREESNDD